MTWGYLSLALTITIFRAHNTWFLFDNVNVVLLDDGCVLFQGKICVKKPFMVCDVNLMLRVEKNIYAAFKHGTCTLIIYN